MLLSVGCVLANIERQPIIAPRLASANRIWRHVTSAKFGLYQFSIIQTIIVEIVAAMPCHAIKTLWQYILYRPYIGVEFLVS